LHELDEMTMSIYETGETFQTKHRPLIIITSNNEKELPDAFLRRCVFHFIAFPNVQQMVKIVRVHHPQIEDMLLDQLLEKFYALRNLQQLRKLPSTSELIDWIAVLIKAAIDPQRLAQKIPFLGTLLKKEQDLQTVEQLLLRKKSDLR
jgi:MoxR-like ATPase